VSGDRCLTVSIVSDDLLRATVGRHVAATYQCQYAVVSDLSSASRRTNRSVAWEDFNL